MVVVHTGFMDLARYCGGLENELYAELCVGYVCSRGTRSVGQDRIASFSEVDIRVNSSG